MINDNPKFGLPTNRTPLDRYIGKYVLIYARSGSNVAGKITGIDGDFLVLNPFSGAIFSEENGLTKKLINDDSIFNMHNVGNIEPTTKENIETYLSWDNKKNPKS